MITHKIFGSACAVFGKAVMAGVVVVGLLLGANTASAEVRFGDQSEPNKATGILDLNVGGKLYDVTFNVDAIAAEIYGDYPGEFPAFDMPRRRGRRSLP